MAMSDQIRQAVVECELPLLTIAQRAGIPQPVLYRVAYGEKQRDGSYVYRNLGQDNLDALAELFGMRLTKPKRVR